LVVVLQTGLGPPHWASLVQARQVPLVTLHSDVAPVHFVVFVAEHTPHAPLGWQAGVAPPHSPSPVQPRQACVAASHVGVVPPHCASRRQPTQVADDGLQTEVVPVHREPFVAEHAPHEPLG
jgi:hypothetical protein